jgi:hypothetical protein
MVTGPVNNVRAYACVWLACSLCVLFDCFACAVNADGIPIRPAKGMDDELTHKYAANISQLAAKARSVIRDLDPQVRHPNDTPLRPRTHASSSHRQTEANAEDRPNRQTEATDRDASSNNANSRWHQCSVAAPPSLLLQEQPSLELETGSLFRRFCR